MERTTAGAFEPRAFAAATYASKVFPLLGGLIALRKTASIHEIEKNNNSKGELTQPSRDHSGLQSYSRTRWLSCEVVTSQGKRNYKTFAYVVDRW
jgi:hypothetical protein